MRKTRAVKKSAIIIGSSAGAGAGVGAAVGGKKGALIGAAHRRRRRERSGIRSRGAIGLASPMAALRAEPQIPAPFPSRVVLESFVLLISSALALGFLHGLGADHLMAIAALSVGAAGETPALQRTRALGVAVRFAIGHALLLALGAGALVALGWSLPLVVERGGEVLGGVLLIVLGGVGLWGVGAAGSTATRTGTATSPRRTGTCTSAGRIIIRRRPRTRTCRRSSARRSRSAACAR